MKVRWAMVHAIMMPVLTCAAPAGPLPEINLEMAVRYSEAQDGFSVLVMRR